MNWETETVWRWFKHSPQARVFALDEPAEILRAYWGSQVPSPCEFVDVELVDWACIEDEFAYDPLDAAGLALLNEAQTS